MTSAPQKIAPFAWLASMVAIGGCDSSSMTERTYGADASSTAHAVALTTDGGLVVVGAIRSVGSQNQQAWLMRVDDQGEAVWQREVGNGQFALAQSVAELSGGELAVVGHRFVADGDSQLWVARFSSTGELVWELLLGGASLDGAKDVAPTTDGGLIIAGYTEDPETFYKDGWLLKVGPDGASQWEKKLGGARGDWFEGVVETTERDIVAVGATNSIGAGSSDMWAVRLRADGEHVWEQTFGGEYEDYANDVVVADSGFLLVGVKDPGTEDRGDCWVVKIDSNGRQQWDQTFGDRRHDVARSAARTPNGFIIAGSTVQEVTESIDALLVELDHSGSIVSENLLRGADYQSLEQVVVTQAGEIVAVGFREEVAFEGRNAWVLKWKN